ncbi:MAG TPA: universal stress protein [Dehalococcoidia bacterium]|nr:universal stress protein [Dehalococcoidia bacterium]
MRILLTIDGSHYSYMATRMVEALHLPPQTDITVMTVVPEHAFLGGITLGKLRAVSDREDMQHEKALKLLQDAAQALNKTGLKIESVVRRGNPADEILKTADEVDASLIVMGAKGLTDPLAFRLGSVTQTVMKYAKGSVLLVRQTIAITGPDAGAERKLGMNRVLLATDGSEQSQVATQFLLDLTFPRKCEIIVVTALQSHLVSSHEQTKLPFQTDEELLARLQTEEERHARRIITRVEKQFKNLGYKTISEILRGGAAESILKAARKYDPDVVVLGSRGLGVIERLLLGSVAERVARYANCSVLIGRPHE